MSKGSNRRPQLVDDDIAVANWETAFDAVGYRYACDSCGWLGYKPTIAGSEPPYANVCPLCDCKL